MTGPHEKVALSFSRVEQEYVVQAADGGRAGAVLMSFDMEKNCEF